MNHLTSNNRFLTTAIICSVILHFVGVWFLCSIEQKILIETAGQRHINVSLASAHATPQASPENTKSSAPLNAQPKQELNKEAARETPANPLRQTAETTQAQKQKTKPLEKKTPEPASKQAKKARDEFVTSSTPGPASEPARTQPVLDQEHKIKPESVKQTQAEIKKDLQETTSDAQVSERTRDIPKAAESAESESTSPPVPSIPRYQLGSAANPEPDYPMLARKKGWQGDVILGVHLDADGSIKHLTFVKSTDYGILNHAAYETVRTQWRFDPIEGDSTLENSYIEVPISFRFE